MTCEVCGESIIGTCKHKYPDHIIVLPSELQPGDIWRAPDEHLYLVNNVVFVEACNGWPEPMLPYWELRTAQRKTWRVQHFYLPLLVKRQLICGAPICELHCATCLDRSERERGKAEFSTTRTEERRHKKQVAAQHERHMKEAVLSR